MKQACHFRHWAKMITFSVRTYTAIHFRFLWSSLSMPTPWTKVWTPIEDDLLFSRTDQRAIICIASSVISSFIEKGLLFGPRSMIRMIHHFANRQGCKANNLSLNVLFRESLNATHDVTPSRARSERFLVTTGDAGYYWLYITHCLYRWKNFAI